MSTIFLAAAINRVVLNVADLTVTSAPALETKTSRRTLKNVVTPAPACDAYSSARRPRLLSRAWRKLWRDEV